jgi:hypothetical protein
MAQIHIDIDNQVVTIAGLDKLWALIESATHRPDHTPC